METKPRDELYCGVDKNKITEAQVKIHPENFGYLVHFMQERFQIHLNKDILKKPAPWTDDKILREYRFTNVFREDDYVTRELIHQAQSLILTLEEKVLNTILFRAWNNPRTFKDFGGPWNTEMIYSGRLKECVRPIYQRLHEEDPNRLWWSGAYNQGGTKNAWKFPDPNKVKERKTARNKKGASAFNDYEKDIPLRVFHIGAWLKEMDFFNRIMQCKNQREAFELIKDIQGFADFLAYQVFIDLCYIPEFPFSENEFVVAGPGCKKGLDYIFIDADGLTYSEQIFKLKEILESRAPQLNLLYKQCDKQINIMSLENCMCEISKYIRAAQGTGRPRCKYRPRKEV